MITVHKYFYTTINHIEFSYYTPSLPKKIKAAPKNIKTDVLNRIEK